MQTGDVAKDRHLHVRVGPEDEARLSKLSAHYEMPEAQVVRMLIKREAEAVIALTADRFELTDDHRTILHALSNGDVLERDDIAREIDNFIPRGFKLGNALNELQRHGYVRRLSRGEGGFRYEQTAKSAALWKPVKS